MLILRMMASWDQQVLIAVTVMAMVVHTQYSVLSLEYKTLCLQVAL